MTNRLSSEQTFIKYSTNSLLTKLNNYIGPQFFSHRQCKKWWGPNPAVSTYICFFSLTLTFQKLTFPRSAFRVFLCFVSICVLTFLLTFFLFSSFFSNFFFISFFKIREFRNIRPMIETAVVVIIMNKSYKSEMIEKVTQKIKSIIVFCANRLARF